MTTAATALAAGIWAGDPIHSGISFKVRQMGIGKVRGAFALSSAVLTVNDGGRVSAVIDAASVHTGNGRRDQHLRSASFLDVDKYPTIEFASTGVRGFDGGTFTLAGELTLHGVTEAVQLETEFFGVTAGPSGGQRTGFSAATRISRAAFGVGTRSGFGAVIGDAIEVAIEIEFTAGGSDQR